MRSSKVNERNYIVVQGWMLTDLHLKGNELLIYACIYGFSQLDGQVFSGSLQYLADWTNSTKRGVVKCLKSLVEKGYIAKADKVINGVKFCEYRVTKFTGVVNKVHGGSEQSSPGGDEHSSPNKLDINNLENKKVYKVFVKPTLEEIQAYCAERKNNVDPKKFFDFYEAAHWIDSKGKPVQSWKQKVITWERSESNGQYGNNGKHRNVNFTPYPDEY